MNKEQKLKSLISDLKEMEGLKRLFFIIEMVSSGI